MASVSAVKESKVKMDQESEKAECFFLRADKYFAIDKPTMEITP